jgi:hypothetical protein
LGFLPLFALLHACILSDPPVPESPCFTLISGHMLQHFYNTPPAA